MTLRNLVAGMAVEGGALRLPAPAFGAGFARLSRAPGAPPAPRWL